MKKIYNKNIGFIFILAMVFLHNSCAFDDFLESEYTGMVSPQTLNEYSLLLNSLDLSFSLNYSNNGAPLISMTDDVKFQSSSGNSIEAAFGWNRQFYFGMDDPTAWTSFYKRIYTYNTVYNEIDDIIDGSSLEVQEKKKTLKAEALLGRALDHFMLVNLFSQPYSDANKTKPGIPYIDYADISKPVPPRETIEDTYSKIEADLLNAISDLPDIQEDITRGSKIGAYGLLGRLYLYKGEWESSLTYINKALEIKSDYLDYTTTRYPYFIQDNPDNVYLKSNSNGNISRYLSPSQELLELYDSSDTRVTKHYFNGNEFVTFGGPITVSNTGISIPVLILTKAELLARIGTQQSIQEAVALINEFMAKRIEGFIPIDITDKEVALSAILEERRREMVYTGLRWFDMRRLDLEGRMSTVTHENTFTNETFTLEPGSSSYTLQIPSLIIAQEGFEQNP